MAKNIIPDPGNLKVTIHNTLDRNVYVIVTPSADYRFMEFIAGFAQIASGISGVAGSLGQLSMVMRMFSLTKDAKALIDKFKEEIPKIAQTVPGHQSRNVFDLYRDNPQLLINPVNFFNLFGGSGFTVMVIDDNFERSVMFNTALDKEYVVNEDGVSGHRWNAGGITTDVKSSTPPSLAIVNGELLMAFRDATGKSIYLAKFDNGRFVTYGTGGVNHGSSDAIGITDRGGTYMLAARHVHGDQMFSLWRKPDLKVDEPMFRWMGRDIQGRPSASTLTAANGNQWTMFVAKHYKGEAALWFCILPNGELQHDNTWLNTLYPPAVQVFRNIFYMAYVDIYTGQVKMAFSKTGGQWNFIVNLGVATSAGPALAVYRDRMYIFYRDPKGNGVFFAWTDDGQRYHNLRDVDDKYTGLDVNGEPTACALPGGESGIMIAGRAADQSIYEKLIKSSEEVVMTMFYPHPKAKSVSAKKKKVAAKKKKTAEKKKKVAKKAKQKPASKKRATKKTGKPTSKKKAVKTKGSKKKVARKLKPVVAKRRPVIRKSVKKKKVVAKKRTTGKR